MNRHRRTQHTTTDQNGLHPASNTAPATRYDRSVSTETSARVISQADQDNVVGLLRRVANGDREAFAAFYQLTSRRVYGLARRLTGDDEPAGQITQEIYLQVWQDAHHYRPAAGSVMAWLMTMTHRTSVAHVRSPRTTRDPGVAKSPADRIQTHARVEGQGVLSPLQREAISLAYDNCLTHREVAEHLSVSPPVIRTGISTGLTHLRSFPDGA